MIWKREKYHYVFRQQRASFESHSDIAWQYPFYDLNKAQSDTWQVMTCEVLKLGWDVLRWANMGWAGVGWKDSDLKQVQRSVIQSCKRIFEEGHVFGIAQNDSTSVADDSQKHFVHQKTLHLKRCVG